MERIGHYVLVEAFASGGMATLHLGRRVASGRSGEVLAIKRLPAHLASQHDFVAMFLDEARLASRICHPNVVRTHDIVASERAPLIVMDFVVGQPVMRFVAGRATTAPPVPPAIAAAILRDALRGLHAAHEATDDEGRPLAVVHRDVSPQNLLVGADGVTRLLDFGVAKALGRIHVTGEVKVKGKLAYMAPEQLAGAEVDRRADVFAASVVLWELLTGSRLLCGHGKGPLEQIVGREFLPPSSEVTGEISADLDAVVMRGLARDPAARFKTAEAMARALEAATALATRVEVADWIASTAGDSLREQRARLERVASIELGATASGRAASASSGSLTGVAQPAPPAGSPSTPRRVVAWIAPFALLLLGLCLPGSSPPRPVARALAATSRGATPAPVPSASPATVERPSVDPPEPSAHGPRRAPAPPTHILGPGRAPASPRASAPPPTSAPLAASVAASVRAPPSAPSCDVPYVIDAQGIRHYDRSCLP